MRGAASFSPPSIFSSPSSKSVFLGFGGSGTNEAAEPGLNEFAEGLKVLADGVNELADGVKEGALIALGLNS